MTVTTNTPVGLIATEHPLATRVFARHGIDFCCGGGRPLDQVCSAKGLEIDAVLAEIQEEVAASPAPEIRWDREPVSALIDHILQHYHEPLKEELPRVEAMARKVHQVHGDKDPALGEILDVYLALKAELDQHMMKEEQILFPMILEGQGATADGPISVMESEHEAAGQMLARLHTLTGGYEVPDGACNTWRALWAGLADLESSLHEHIHLENNVLHPRALAS
ncbi:MAG: iron-sulfur cluster repair di-iron protein [Thermoanaerobaculia bacterium]